MLPGQGRSPSQEGSKPSFPPRTQITLAHFGDQSSFFFFFFLQPGAAVASPTRSPRGVHPPRAPFWGWHGGFQRGRSRCRARGKLGVYGRCSQGLHNRRQSTGEQRVLATGCRCSRAASGNGRDKGDRGTSGDGAGGRGHSLAVRKLDPRDAEQLRGRFLPETPPQIFPPEGRGRWEGCGRSRGVTAQSQPGEMALKSLCPLPRLPQPPPLSLCLGSRLPP